MHCPVIGLKDGKVKNQYRKYKNIIENYYSVLKPYYYRTRGFGSFDGAVSFSVLFTLYYNYLHPSDRFDDKPIIQIEGLNYSHPILPIIHHIWFENPGFDPLKPLIFALYQ